MIFNFNDTQQKDTFERTAEFFNPSLLVKKSHRKLVRSCSKKPIVNKRFMNLLNSGIKEEKNTSNTLQDSNLHLRKNQSLPSLKIENRRAQDYNFTANLPKTRNWRAEMTSSSKFLMAKPRSQPGSSSKLQEDIQLRPLRIAKKINHASSNRAFDLSLPFSSKKNIRDFKKDSIMQTYSENESYHLELLSKFKPKLARLGRIGDFPAFSRLLKTGTEVDLNLQEMKD